MFKEVSLFHYLLVLLEKFSVVGSNVSVWSGSLVLTTLTMDNKSLELFAKWKNIRKRNVNLVSGWDFVKYNMCSTGMYNVLREMERT